MQKTLLLDLDGTLTDPYTGISRCIRHALSCLEIPAPAAADLKSWIGPPLKQSFQSWFEVQQADADADRALALYRERFSSIGLFENEVYPGIPELLDYMARSGNDLILATAKPGIYAKQILLHFELEKYFSAVYGAELDGRYADKTELLAMIMAAEGLEAPDCTMIGDRHHDIDAARAHAMKSIGVLWGYGSRAELQEAGADWIVGSVDQLTRILMEADNG